MIRYSLITMWIKLFIILNIILIHFAISQDVGEDCVTNDQGLEGTCTRVFDCEAAMIEIQNKHFNQFKRCGFIGSDEVVCCPHLNNKDGGSESITTTSRVAENECKKIEESSIPAVGLHILGGEEAALGEFPHMVALGYDRGEGYIFDCGASVLSRTYALSAAHCVDTLDRIRPSIIRGGVVEIGGKNFNPETDYRIVDIIFNPRYLRREKYHDLALIRINEPFQFSSSLNAVCLETDDADPKIPLTITGWGKTSNTRDVKSSILLKANVTTVRREKCSESYVNWRKLPQGISSDQLCAGDPQGIRDTCQGDSGGPLQSQTPAGLYRLVGVTSFGRGCGSSVPGVYTRVSHYIDWIESVVWSNQY